MTALTSQQQTLQEVLEHFVKKHALPLDYIETAQKWFVPLALTLKKHQQSAGKPLVVGINGCQGSGKSTLSALLVDILSNVFATPSLAFSIDDFYLSKQSRTNLSTAVHPLLATRGVPGTHDIVLLHAVLSKLRQQVAVHIPVFDKSIDDVKPAHQWVKVTNKPQIIILEGWCVGVEGQQKSQLAMPVNALEKQEDADGSWRQYVNDTLMIDYKPVFSTLDYLVMLQAPSFQYVYAWRCEQEHKLINTLGSKKGTDEMLNNASKQMMSDEQIYRFIQFYQRLTQHALVSLPAKCDCVFLLNDKRSIVQCR